MHVCTRVLQAYPHPSLVPVFPLQVSAKRYKKQDICRALNKVILNYLNELAENVISSNQIINWNQIS